VIGLLLISLLMGCASLEQLRAPRLPLQLQAGLQYLAVHKEEQALVQFDDYLEANAADLSAYLEVAEVCARVQRWDIALRYAERGLKAVPNGPTNERIALYGLLGEIYYRQGNVPMALQAHRNAYNLAPDNPTLMNNLGYMYAEMPEGRRNLPEALRLTTAAVTRAREQNLEDKQVGVFLDSLGWVYYRMGRYDEAIAALARAAEMDRDEAAIPFHLALAYHKKGRDEEAYVALQRALRIDPRTRWIHAQDEEARKAVQEIMKQGAARLDPPPEDRELGR